MVLAWVITIPAAGHGRLPHVQADPAADGRPPGSRSAPWSSCLRDLGGLGDAAHDPCRGRRGGDPRRGGARRAPPGASRTWRATARSSRRRRSPAVHVRVARRWGTREAPYTCSHHGWLMSSTETEFRDLQAAATSHRGDRVFNRVVTAAAFSALLVLAGIAIFLGLQTITAFQSQGMSFLTTTAWDINTDPPTAGILGHALRLRAPGRDRAGHRRTGVHPDVGLHGVHRSEAPGIGADQPHRPDGRHPLRDPRPVGLLHPEPDGGRVAAAAQPVPRLDPDLREHVRQLPGHALHRRLRARDHDDPDHHVRDA